MSPVSSFGSTLRTLPTFTPEIRTSASCASWVASGKATFTRYPSGWSGTEPPKESQRKIRIPKQDSAKATMVRMRPTLGACLIIRTGGGATGVSLRKPVRLFGQRTRSSGKFASLVSMPSCGLPWMSGASTPNWVHEASTIPRSIGPWASSQARERGARVRGPAAPEQEGLGVAGRVVRQRVEEVVEHLEAARQAGRDRREVVRGGAQVAHRGLHVARERPDLVADDRRGVAQERLLAAQRGSQLARERPQPLERRAELLGQRVACAGAWWRSGRASPGRAGAPRAGSPPPGRTPRSSRSRSPRRRPAACPSRRAPWTAPGSCGSRGGCSCAA